MTEIDSNNKSQEVHGEVQETDRIDQQIDIEDKVEDSTYDQKGTKTQNTTCRHRLGEARTPIMNKDQKLFAGVVDNLDMLNLDAG